MDAIDQGIKVWAAERTGVAADQISRVEFETIDGGYCETCAYTTAGVVIYFTNNRTPYEITYVDFGEIIREVTQKIQEV